MKFSFNCQNTYADPTLFEKGLSYPVPSKYYDSDVGIKSFEDHLEMVRYADEVFDWISVSEHHGWPILQAPNAALLIAAYAVVCKRATLAWMGPLVSMNNPIRIAEECAMLDQITGGRLVCLFLRGTPNEFLVYGVPANETRERTQEAIHLIQRALSEPYPFSWQGRYFKYGTVGMWPSRTQKPMVPILSSGNSLESCTFAAKHRHGLAISFYPPEIVANLVAFYKDECARFGWEPSSDWILYRAFAAVGKDDAEGEERSDRFFGRNRGGLTMSLSGARARHMASEFKMADPPKRIDSDQKDGGVSGFALGQLAFKGSADTVVNQVRAFADLTGVGIIDVAFNGGGLTSEESFDCLRRFGDDVIPQLRGSKAPALKTEVAGVAG